MSDARREAEQVNVSRARAASRRVEGSAHWWGWQVWFVVSSGIPLHVVLREWSLIDVWEHYYHVALARAMEA